MVWIHCIPAWHIDIFLNCLESRIFPSKILCSKIQSTSCCCLPTVSTFSMNFWDFFPIYSAIKSISKPLFQFRNSYLLEQAISCSNWPMGPFLLCQPSKPTGPPGHSSSPPPPFLLLTLAERDHLPRALLRHAKPPPTSEPWQIDQQLTPPTFPSFTQLPYLPHAR
jgi:hypothetical protein